MKIIEYFKELNENVNYILMRNIKQIEDNSFKDLDLLIDKKDLDKFKKTTLEFIKNNNLVVLQVVETYTGIIYIIQTNSSILEIDVRWYINYKNKLLEGQKFLENKVLNNDIYIPDEFNSLLLLLLHNKKEKYQDKINLLQKKYQDKLSDNTFDSLIISNNKKMILKFNFFIKKILTKKREPIIVFHGTDGVGKTTLIDLILEDFQAKHIKIYTKHSGGKQGTLLPSRKKKRKNQNNGKVYDSLRLLYHTIDFIHMYFTVLYTSSIYGKRIILDKYYTYLIKHEDMGFNVPKWLPTILYKFFIPKPDIFILLWNEPEEVLKRKQERTYDEIVEDQKQLEQFGSLSKKFYKIKTDKSPEELKKEVFDILGYNK